MEITAMSAYITTLKSLYTQNLITIGTLDRLLSENKITQEEYDFIVS